jgi:hypothetical protein
MALTEKPPLDADLLMHYGVKGMRWGVRKDESSSGTPAAKPQRMSRNEKRDARLASSEFYSKDFVQRKDVYRIVAGTGSRKLKDIAYVSTNDVDNQRYIHILNHTISARLIKSARYEKQIVLGPKVPLKAPSVQKAEAEIKKLHDSSPTFQKFVKDNEVYFGQNPDGKKINQIMNTAFVDDDNLFTGAIKMRQEVKQHFQKLGYNSMLDQNDMREGLAKTPLIVFDPEKTLRVVSQSKIDNVIKAAATQKYKDTNASNWIDSKGGG